VEAEVGGLTGDPAGAVRSGRLEPVVIPLASCEAPAAVLRHGVRPSRPPPVPDRPSTIVTGGPFFRVIVRSAS
jgi:hypothetical protein